MYSDLMKACKNASVDTDKSLDVAIRPGALGINVPMWATAHIPFPGEGVTFDMHTAIMFASASFSLNSYDKSTLTYLTCF